MTTLYNTLVYFLVIFIGSEIFPKNIVCSGWKMALQVTVVYAVVALILVIAIYPLMSIMLALTTNNILKVIVAIVYAILFLMSPFISLVIVEHAITGFEINGIFTYIAITILASIFSIKTSTE